LAAGAARRWEVRADQDRLEFDALAFEDADQELLDHGELRLRITLRAESVLVADHDEAEAGVAKLDQCRDRAVHEAEFFDRIDLMVGGLDDQRAVAVEEGDLIHPSASRKDASARRFSIGVPTETRMQPVKPVSDPRS